VFLAEPPLSRYDLNFSLLGVPVRIHPFFWLASLFLGINLEQPKLVALWMLAVLLSILVHEFGHVMAFRACGLASRVVLHAFGGLAIADRGGYRDSYFEPTAGYNPASRPDGDSPDGWRQVFISLAGPLAGFLFAGLIVAGLYAAGATVPFDWFGTIYWLGRGEMVPQPNLRALLFLLLDVNIWWGILNLFPVYPLDGGKIARELFLMQNASEGIGRSLKLSIATAILLAVGAIYRDPKDGTFMALMFGLLAYSSYQNLKAYNDFGRYRGSDW
jgi:Zn-dependent protease